MLSASAPNGCLKGFIIVVAPNAAAGAPCHAGVLVTARGRVRSRGCGSLVSVVGDGVEAVGVLGEAKAERGVGRGGGTLAADDWVGGLALGGTGADWCYAAGSGRFGLTGRRAAGRGGGGSAGLLGGALEEAEALAWRVGCWGGCAVGAGALLLLLRLWRGALWCGLLTLVVGAQLGPSFCDRSLCLVLAYRVWVVCSRRRTTTTGTCIA